jgi:hypothetical protein
MKKLYAIPALVALLILPAATPADEGISIRYESRPDAIVIYPGNLVYGRDGFSLPAGQAEITLPAQVIPESVMLSGGGRVLTGFKTRTDSTNGRTVLVCSMAESTGKDLTLDYLLRGAQWSPVYNMTILADNRVSLDFSAGITSTSLTLAETDVRLLSGLVISSDLSGDIDIMTASQMQNNIGYFNREMELSETTAGVSATGDHHLYKAGRFSMVPGERMVTGIVSKELTARKLLVWDTRNGDRTETVYKVSNDTGFPLPPGMVRIYQDGIYTGSDSLEWTPSGGEGSLTTAGMPGIRVRKLVSFEVVPNTGRNKVKYTVTLTIENLSGEAVSLTILDQRDGNGSSFEYSKKPEEQPGNILRWEIPLASGKKETITYRYMTGENY